MGFIKKTMFYGFGVPVRPTSRKERLYRHQMGYDDLSIGNFVKNVFGSGDTTSNQSSDLSNMNAFQSTNENRVACPTCAELIMPAAVKCRFCNEVTNFSQQAAIRNDSPPKPSHVEQTHTPAFVVGQKQLNKVGGIIGKIVDQSKVAAAGVSQCPACKGQIIKGATKCRYCKSVISEQGQSDEK